MNIIKKLAALSFATATAASAPANALVDYDPDIYPESHARTYNIEGCTSDNKIAELKFGIYRHRPLWEEKVRDDEENRDAQFEKTVVPILNREWKTVIGKFNSTDFNWQEKPTEQELIDTTIARLDPMREEIENATGIPVVISVAPVHPAVLDCK